MEIFQFMMERFWQSIGSMIGIAAGILAIVDGIKTKFKGGAKRKLVYIACGAAFIVSVLSLMEQYKLYKEGDAIEKTDEADNTDNMNNNSVEISGTGMAVIGSGNTVTIHNPAEPSESADSAGAVTVTGVLMNQEDLVMHCGESVVLTATVLYSDNSKDNNVCWASSDESVVKVDSSGNAFALSKGTAWVTAQASSSNQAESARRFVIVSDAPSGYAISLSSEAVVLGETFYVYIEPYDDDVTEIVVCAESPSGEVFRRPLEDGAFFIYTETGKWTIYAVIKNKGGEYKAEREEDFVTIDVGSSFGMDILYNGIFVGSPHIAAIQHSSPQNQFQSLQIFQLLPYLQMNTVQRHHVQNYKP